MPQSSSPSGKSVSTPEEEPPELLLPEELGVEAGADDELEGSAEEVGVEEDEDEDSRNSAGWTEGVGVGVGVEVGVELLEELWQASGGATPLAHKRVPSAIPLQTSAALILWPLSSYSKTVPEVSTVRRA